MVVSMKLPWQCNCKCTRAMCTCNCTQALTSPLPDAACSTVRRGQRGSMKLWEKYAPNVWRAGRKPRCEAPDGAGGCEGVASWRGEQGSLQALDCFHINQILLSVGGWCVFSTVPKLAAGLCMYKLELHHYFEILVVKKNHLNLKLIYIT